MPELFYQFGLDIQSVKKDFSRMGLECVHTRAKDRTAKKDQGRGSIYEE